MFRPAAILLIVIASVLTVLRFAEAKEKADASNPMSFAATATYTTVPIGWYLFCKEHLDECHKLNAPRADDRVALTESLWKTLIDVDLLVNANITGISDEDHYHISKLGITNWWTYPDDGQGNCNDYAILKKKLLVEAGWPANSLYLTVVLDLENQGHLVLMARTDRGDLILDNLTDRIRLWRDTGYTYLKRQSAENPDVWVSFAPEARDYAAHHLSSVN